MKNCNKCKWVSVTEEEQSDKKANHICLKHKVRVLHRSFNPNMFHDYIYPCEECNGDDFEQR